jgi:hypothetical protein
VVTYITADLPAGSTIYLQRAAGTGGAWQSVGRMTADSGTVRAPADPAGRYRYRYRMALAPQSSYRRPAYCYGLTGAGPAARARVLPVAPPVAPDDEFLECAETVSSHPRTGIGAFKRDAEVGGEVGCVANLALCPEDFR